MDYPKKPVLHILLLLIPLQKIFPLGALIN